MKKSSLSEDPQESKEVLVEEEEESGTTNRAKCNHNLSSLIQQFETLQREWDSMGKSKSRTRSSPKNSNNNSPRSLMSSLQHTHYGCNAAVEEILRDRRAAIATGKLKGRRLFPEDYGDLGEEEKGVVVVKKAAVGRSGGWLPVAAGWVVGVVLVLVTIVGISWMKLGIGKYVYGEEMMTLVPT